MSHKTTTHWKGGMQFESDNPSGKTVLMDTVVKGQAEQFGVSPKAMMLSALAGCSGIDIVDILEKMKVVDYELKMEVEGFLTDEHPKYYDKVHVDYHFTGTDLSPKKIDKAVKLSVDKYCGVMEMFRQFSTVTTTIHIHNS
ncbi:osmotically inducible protein OsmC [Formosa sp. Hel1_33_131]|jgi:putative redox protein|uniref:OsmC family protein n=1 Tax=Formosa sp. Hel1_33_131 TaxID=1336794 RepID=UPI00084E3355|nr:OsmC family protein [Formosa sp. Hel1_33_131]AOR28130.1 osmotically inducible protein OsmC [Formosa sp. Hel1_33_131]